MKSETCCGAVIFRKVSNGFEYLIIKNKVGGHWDFPKGHVEKGESEKETAAREIYEEVGLQVRFIDGFRESISYIDEINKVKKTVVFFVCEALSSKVRHGADEIEDYRWLEQRDAEKKLTYANALDLLKKASFFLERNTKITPNQILQNKNLNQ